MATNNLDAAIRCACGCTRLTTSPDGMRCADCGRLEGRSAASTQEQTEVTLAVLRLRARELAEAHAALDALLAWAERAKGGDPSLDPEEWYAVRDHARIVRDRIARLFDA